MPDDLSSSIAKPNIHKIDKKLKHLSRLIQLGVSVGITGDTFTLQRHADHQHGICAYSSDCPDGFVCLHPETHEILGKLVGIGKDNQLTGLQLIELYTYWNWKKNGDH